MHFPIDLKLPLNLGGVQQTLRIWGTDENNPVILFLHGGPGIPNRHGLMKHQQALTRDFTLAAWDQRGTGIGFCQEAPTPEQLVRDCGKIIDYLCLRYYQTKVILVCSGFGIRLGQLVTQKYPHKVSLCIACGDPNDVQATVPGRLSLLLTREYSLEEITGIQKGHALWRDHIPDWPAPEENRRVPCFAIPDLPETAAQPFQQQFQEIINKELTL